MADKPMTPPVNQSGWVPVPDPTARTAEQLAIAITALREVIETRLNGMDRAMELLQAITDQMPSRIDEKIASLEKVHEEKFSSIKQQFTERDERDVRAQRDNKVSVDAALQAAKEAVGENNKSTALSQAKSEAATDKRIDQMSVLITATAKASDEKIDDIKERLTRIEGVGQGKGQQLATAIAIGGLVLGIILFFIGRQF